MPEPISPARLEHANLSFIQEVIVLSGTTERVEVNTAPAVNRKFEDQLKENIARYAAEGQPGIDQRLRELDREWNTERAIEVEAPMMIGLGIALGNLHDRKWFAVSAMAAGMVILHSVQGWYPLLPLFRRMGLRSQYEIEQERNALRALRGDHLAYQPAIQASH
jgi:hypothetical protein